MNSNQQLIRLRNAYHKLKMQYDMLKAENQDLTAQVQNLKRQSEIINYANDTQNLNKINQQTLESLQKEVQFFKNQCINQVSQKQNLTRLNDELKQKVNDLKYNITQLKAFNQKLSNIHSKEIEMLKKQLTATINSMEQNQKKQKIKLEKCCQIVREQQIHYKNEFAKYNELLNRKESQIREVTRELQMYRNQFEKTQQNKLEDIIKKQNLQKKWELKNQQIKQKYQKQITILKENITILVNKLQSMQDHSSNATIIMSHEGMTQSKFLQSNSSNDSCRFTPNNSFSSSAKESLSRRNGSTVKTPTPNKYMINAANPTKNVSKQFGALFEKTNFV